MRTIAHLSDIHYGTVDDAIAGRVVEKINEIGPDVVVVSGDLTQRARTEQFKAARLFLDQLPRPLIVVPGNHDVPLYNIYDRFFRPLKKYKEHITTDLSPEYFDDELAVVGINTARSLTIKGGRVSREQIDEVRSQMCGLDDGILKVVVTHHPFDLPEGMDERDIVGRAQKAMPRLADCGADVFLSGHLHVSNIETTAKRYTLNDGHVALIIQAGTATSARVRGEAHSFNVIEFDAPMLKVERLECLSVREGFRPAEHKLYSQVPRGWDRID
ncbi:MAG TPA: metallophosphoesterase [Pyrinomonadaceae bacterium]|nr:metallophosphoesterase [Pyrinomonadaceae bacterium]